jgi:osmotically-inducible protein OsmY
MPFDKQLRQAELAKLDWEPSVVAAHIGVTANAGVVTLTGIGSGRLYAGHGCWTTAWAAPGATSVENDIAIL